MLSGVRTFGRPDARMPGCPNSPTPGEWQIEAAAVVQPPKRSDSRLSEAVGKRMASGKWAKDICHDATVKASRLWQRSLFAGWLAWWRQRKVSTGQPGGVSAGVSTVVAPTQITFKTRRGTRVTRLLRPKSCVHSRAACRPQSQTLIDLRRAARGSAAAFVATPGFAYAFLA